MPISGEKLHGMSIQEREDLNLRKRKRIYFSDLFQKKKLIIFSQINREKICRNIP